jgi:hypothetical protein
MKAQREVAIYLYTFLNLGAIWGWMISVKTRPLYRPEREQVHIVQEAGWVRKISPSTGIGSTDRTASSELLWKVALNIHPTGVDI